MLTWTRLDETITVKNFDSGFWFYLVNVTRKSFSSCSFLLCGVWLNQIIIFYRELMLNNNQLRALPCELGKLFQLQLLGLHGNPLGSDIMSMYTTGTNCLLTYLLDNLPGWYLGTWKMLYFQLLHCMSLSVGFSFQNSCFFLIFFLVNWWEWLENIDVIVMDIIICDCDSVISDGLLLIVAKIYWSKYSDSLLNPSLKKTKILTDFRFSSFNQFLKF